MATTKNTNASNSSSNKVKDIIKNKQNAKTANVEAKSEEKDINTQGQNDNAQKGGDQQDIKNMAEKLKDAAVDSQQDSNAKDQQIAALQAEVAEGKDKLIRAVAEMENIKKRAQKQAEDSFKFAVTDFAKDLLNVLDNLYRATDALSQEDKELPILKSFLEGVEMTKSEFIKAFEKHGVKRIFPQGEKFDHNFHQAISQIESDQGSGMVIDVMQAGYVINERLLRPAMVVVSK